MHRAIASVLRTCLQQRAVFDQRVHVRRPARHHHTLKQHLRRGHSALSSTHNPQLHSQALKPLATEGTVNLHRRVRGIPHAPLPLLRFARSDGRLLCPAAAPNDGPNRVSQPTQWSLDPILPVRALSPPTSELQPPVGVPQRVVEGPAICEDAFGAQQVRQAPAALCDSAAGSQ